MKKYYILSALFTVILCSCNDMLDYQNDGRITLEEAFSTRVRVQGYLNSCYTPIAYPALDWASYSDEAEDSDKSSGSAYVNWYSGLASASSFESYSPDSPWARYFQAIRKCNVFIGNIHSSPADISPERRAGMEAQARTLRAFYYLQLIKRYGGVPIVAETLSTNHDFGQDRRAGFSEVVSFIISDCDKALAVPATREGFPWEVYERQYGIMTRAVAYAIKSQAATYAASPLWSDGTYSWADAAEITGEALGECLKNGYKLFDIAPEANVAQNAYANYFISGSDDMRAIDKETILRGAKMSVWRTAGLPTTTGMESAGPSPSQELIDSYEMEATGLPPITGYSDGSHIMPIINPASGYNANAPYEGRDPRFYASVYFNGAIRNLSETVADFEPITIDVAIDPHKAGYNNNITIVDEGDHWNMTSTTHDPWTVLTPLAAPLERFDGNVSIEFEYKSATEIQSPQIFFAPPIGEANSFKPANIPASSEWRKHSISIKPAIDKGWGRAKDNYLRVDWGNVSGVNFQVKKDIKIRIAPLSGDVVQTYVGGADGLLETGGRYTVTGYYIRKFNNYKSDKDNDSDGENRIFRLAELYLNFAEAVYNSVGSDVQVALPNGTSMSAREAVNAIRTRAGMRALSTGMSKEDFEKRYRNERRVELAFEGHRFFDVRRWKIMTETDRFVSGMKITRSGDQYTYTRFPLDNRNCATEAYYMYPIPQSEVNKMLSHTGVNWQNSGW